jgi:hypothetical protein
MIKQPFRESTEFGEKSVFVQCTNFLTAIVRRDIGRFTRKEPLMCGVLRSSGKGDATMFKVEDIQNYGKEQLEQVVSSASSVQSGLHAIATAYGDYTKKSFEDTKALVEKLSGVKSLDKVIEAQTEFAKSAYETFVADSQKIAGLYGDLAKQAFKPVEGLVAKFTPSAQ